MAYIRSIVFSALFASRRRCVMQTHKLGKCHCTPLCECQRNHYACVVGSNSIQKKKTKAIRNEEHKTVMRQTRWRQHVQQPGIRPNTASYVCITSATSKIYSISTDVYAYRTNTTHSVCTSIPPELLHLSTSSSTSKQFHVTEEMSAAAAFVKLSVRQFVSTDSFHFFFRSFR